MFDLEGKIALITGGNGVLGARSLMAWRHKKWRLPYWEEPKNGERRGRENRKNGGTALALVADVLDKKSLEQAKNKLVEHWGGLDILVNAAGGNRKGATIGPDQTFFDLSLEDFSAVTDLNLKGTVLPSFIFGKIMANDKSGSIINISSMAAQSAITRVVGYSVAKAGVDNFTKWLAVEMAQKYGDGIRVNAIAPGFFVGDQNRDLLLQPDGSLTDRGTTITAQTPMKRFGKPEELQGVALWLASNGSTFCDRNCNSCRWWF